MKTDDNIIFWIVGAAMYVWGMIVFAIHLMQSLWLISFQSRRMIEDAVELFF